MSVYLIQTERGEYSDTQITMWSTSDTGVRNQVVAWFSMIVSRMRDGKRLVRDYYDSVERLSWISEFPGDASQPVASSEFRDMTRVEAWQLIEMEMKSPVLDANDLITHYMEVLGLVNREVGA